MAEVVQCGQCGKVVKRRECIGWFELDNYGPIDCVLMGDVVRLPETVCSVKCLDLLVQRIAMK